MKKLLLLLPIFSVFFTTAQTAFYNGKQDTKQSQQNAGFECAGVDPLDPTNCVSWDKVVFYFWGGSDATHAAIMKAVRSDESLAKFHLEKAPIIARVPNNPSAVSVEYVLGVLVVCEPECLNNSEYATILFSSRGDEIAKYVPKKE